MPFSKERNIITVSKTSMVHILSDRALNTCLFLFNLFEKLPQAKKASSFLYQKRAISFVFHKRAFVSIEAAICLSVFLLSILSLLSFGTIMNQKMKMDIGLRNTASKIAQDYALYDSLVSDEENLIKDFAIRGIGVIAAKQLFVDELGKENLEKSCIAGGTAGISFIYTDIVDDEGYVDIVISYNMDLPFKIIPLPEIKMTQRCRIHPWSGTEVFSSGEKEEEYVYITESGTVYHTSLSCRHINIIVSKLTLGEVGGLRNDFGGKYYPCEICYEAEDGSIIYVTTSGTAYHSDKSCPSINRTVKKVPKSEVIGRAACKSCGG